MKTVIEDVRPSLSDESLASLIRFANFKLAEDIDDVINTLLSATTEHKH